MDFKEIKQHVKELMTAMGRSGIKRLSVKHKDLEVDLERADTVVNVVGSENSSTVRTLPSAVSLEQMSYGQAATHHGTPGHAPHIATHSHGIGSHTAAEPVGQAITSPMVGTFYASSSPESPPLVKTGDVVTKEDVVCIIEAMKVMNEIKAGVAGTITDLLVNNGDPVEFGTVLFRVR